MKNKITRIILPFFPENASSKKHRWHKLIKLLAIIVSVSSIYSILWLVALFYFIPQSWMESPIYQQVYHISYFFAYLPINFTSFLSRFSIYQTVFHSLLPVPVIGPLALIFILISVFYFLPSLLYRLAIYISQKFYLKRVKIILLVVGCGLSFFAFSTWKFQQLINEGSVIADEQCLKVNPLIIERKNHYLNSMKVLQASGSADEYWDETNKYLDTSKKYVEAQKQWLALQKSYIDSKDFNIFIPSYIKEASQAQYKSREAAMKATSTIVELFETYQNIDAEQQKALSDTVLEETNKSKESEDEYNRIYDTSKGTFDLRNEFTTVPQSTCPEENFNIPDLQNLFAPPPVQLNPYGANS